MRAVRERDRGIQRISSTTRAVAAGSMALSAGFTALIAFANPVRAKTVVRSTGTAAALRTKAARAHRRAAAPTTTTTTTTPTTPTTTTIRPAITPPSSSPHGGWQTPPPTPAATAPPVTAPPVTSPPVTDPPVIYNPPPIVSGQS